MKVLRGFRYIDEALEQRLDDVRDIRNKYLHLFSHQHDNIRADAAKVFKLTVDVVVTILGQDVRDGRLVFRPELMRYLQREGVAQPPAVQSNTDAPTA